jgi:hypothetical protein
MLSPRMGGAMPVATTQQLLRELGPEAVEAVKVCVEECRRLGDERAACFWRGVEAELKSMGSSGGPRASEQTATADDVRFARRRWMFMQKVELYRRRAMNAERLAGGSEHLRQSMIDIALQWFELARYYERMAESL